MVSVCGYREQTMLAFVGFGFVFFFFKQKTAYEMRISDWSSDVCSSDLWDEDSITMAVEAARDALEGMDRSAIERVLIASTTLPFADRQNAGVVNEEIGRASCRESVCQYV